jgi:streptogrisin C
MRVRESLLILAGFGLVVVLAPPVAGAQDLAGGTTTVSRSYAIETGERPDIPAPQLGDGPTEAELIDLAAYAKQEGIPLDVVIERYAWQRSFAMLVTSLRKKYPSEFAGAKIESGGNPWIAFRAGVPLAAARMVAEASGLMFGKRTMKVDVIEDRGFSEAGLDARLSAAHFAALERSDLVANASSGYDIETGAITVDIEPVESVSSQAEKEALVASLINDRPGAFEGVTIRVVDSIFGEKTSTIYGGSALSTCTSAFAAYRGGTRGMLTAGHCPDDQWDGSVQLFTTVSYEGAYGDFQFAWSYATESDDFYAGSTVSWQYDRRDLAATGSPVTGMILCRNGKSSYQQCDTVYQLSRCAWRACHLTLMHHSYNISGDSGGPYYYGNTGYGVLQGWMWWGSKRDTFSQVQYLDEAIGATVATS